MLKINNIYNEDCLIGMKKIQDNTINLIFTSPPYAQRRKNTYGGIKSEEYVKWFLPIAKEISRILSEDGSFFFNIKEHTKNGFSDLYVMELILAICKETDLQLVDTIVWTKNAFPGKFLNRFKNAWEPIYHFSKNKKIKFFPKEVAEDIKNPEWYNKNRKKKSTQNGSGFSRPGYDNMREIKKALPSNHIHIKNVVNQYSPNKWHSATFPINLPTFFIKAFSEEEDIILDPFSGSATTLIAAKKLNRKYIGFELFEEYYVKSLELLKD